VITKVRRPGRPLAWVCHGRHDGLSLDSQSPALGCPGCRAIDSKPNVLLWYTAAFSRVDMECCRVVQEWPNQEVFFE